MVDDWGSVSVEWHGPGSRGNTSDLSLRNQNIKSGTAGGGPAAGGRWPDSWYKLSFYYTPLVLPSNMGNNTSLLQYYIVILLRNNIWVSEYHAMQY